MSPLVPQVLRIAPHTFMLGVGVIAIVAGLLTISAYFDVALRDLGLALGAFALARLAQDTEVTGRARRR